MFKIQNFITLRLVEILLRMGIQKNRLFDLVTNNHGYFNGIPLFTDINRYVIDTSLPFSDNELADMRKCFSSATHLLLEIDSYRFMGKDGATKFIKWIDGSTNGVFISVDSFNPLNTGSYVLKDMLLPNNDGNHDLLEMSIRSLFLENVNPEYWSYGHMFLGNNGVMPIAYDNSMSSVKIRDCTTGIGLIDVHCFVRNRVYK